MPEAAVTRAPVRGPLSQLEAAHEWPMDQLEE